MIFVKPVATIPAMMGMMKFKNPCVHIIHNHVMRMNGMHNNITDQTSLKFAQVIIYLLEVCNWQQFWRHPPSKSIVLYFLSKYSNSLRQVQNLRHCNDNA